MGLIKAERETVIRWDEEERVVHVWSASPAVWRKLARLGIGVVRETKRGTEVSGRFYRVPLAQFRWGLKHARPGQAFRQKAAVT
jgi:hypothetical protein